MADGVPDGYGNVRVSFSGSRNVTQSDKDNATIRVFFNGTEVEKKGNVFEGRVPTGTRLTIIAEAVNGGRVVGKGEETITVRGGNNNVSMQVYTYDNFVVTIDGKSTGWTNFTDAWNAANGKTATIKMNADATSVAVTLSSGNVTLDLKGHTINGDSGTVIDIQSGTFILEDSVSGGTIKGINYNVHNSGKFIMNGGIITGGKPATGGGVYNSGTFTMNGGVINDNEVTLYGGGVLNEGTFIMNDGTISNNKITSPTAALKIGGGVYNSNANSTFIMKGGTISENTAYNGGGIAIKAGTFNWYGGIISGNTATTSGNNIYVSQGATYTKNGVPQDTTQAVVIN